MQRVGIDFLQAGAQEAADEELEALELRLDDDELEVGGGVHVARLVLDELNLRRALASACMFCCL
jgi:hypothetical protein